MRQAKDGKVSKGMIWSLLCRNSEKLKFLVRETFADAEVKRQSSSLVVPDPIIALLFL